MTSTTSTTSTNVTRDRGIRFTMLPLPCVAGPAQHPDAVAECAVEDHRDPVGQHQHDRHHYGGLGDEPEPGKPQFDAVPPVQDPAHLNHRSATASVTTTRARTDRCLIAGGGPAGMMLGLLLARAGVDVTVMEKHADFLRDFRGDTVHASTSSLLDELGLGERLRGSTAPDDRVVAAVRAGQSNT